MFKAVFLIALAFGVASAQRWPMITVNAAGEIVLQSLTRAQSFQITPFAVTLGPTGATAATASTATQIPAGVSMVSVTTPSSPASGYGLTLPAATTGATVTIISGESTFSSFTIWTASSSTFVNSDSATVSIPALSRRTVCTAVSTSRWSCDWSAFGQVVAAPGSVTLTATVQALTAPTPAQHGQVFTFNAGGVAAGATNTMSLFSCTTALTGTYFDFIFTSTVAVTTSHLVTVTTNSISVVVPGLTAAGAASATAAAAGTTYATTGTIGLAIHGGATGGFAAYRLLCANGAWAAYGIAMRT